MADPKTGPTIIIRKKAAHGGHHGGAWKVAYADFVTAMMALFIVLWLMNTSKPVQEAISGYFRDPSGTSSKVGSDLKGPASVVVKKESMEDLKKDIEKSLSEVPDFEKLKSHIVLTITSEGLRIELTESAKGTFFDSGSAKITGDGFHGQVADMASRTREGADGVAPLDELARDVPPDEAGGSGYEYGFHMSRNVIAPTEPRR